MRPAVNVPLPKKSKRVGLAGGGKAFRGAAAKQPEHGGRQEGVKQGRADEAREDDDRDRMQDFRAGPLGFKGLLFVKTVCLGYAWPPNEWRPIRSR